MAGGAKRIGVLAVLAVVLIVVWAIFQFLSRLIPQPISRTASATPAIPKFNATPLNELQVAVLVLALLILLIGGGAYLLRRSSRRSAQSQDVAQLTVGLGNDETPRPSRARTNSFHNERPS